MGSISEGTKMSSKNWVRTARSEEQPESGGTLLEIPSSTALLILPMIISDLKGLKTIIRNSTTRVRSVDHCRWRLTIDVNETTTMSNQAIRCRIHIIKADAETDLLDDLVGILCIDVVLNGLRMRS